MVKENITAYINSYALEGEIVVPSQVMTSTPQEQQLNLSYSPNFTMRVEDTYSYLNVTDKVEATFTADDTQYTAYMRVLNRAGNMVTLQYVDGLTSKEAPEPEPTIDTYDVEYFTLVEDDVVPGTSAWHLEPITGDIPLDENANPEYSQPVDFYAKIKKNGEYVTWKDESDNFNGAYTMTDTTDGTDVMVISDYSTGSQYSAIDQLYQYCMQVTIEESENLNVTFNLVSPLNENVGQFSFTTDTRPAAQPQSISISCADSMNVGDTISFEVQDDLGNVITSQCIYNYDDTCMILDAEHGTIEATREHYTAFEAVYGNLSDLHYIGITSSSGNQGPHLLIKSIDVTAGLNALSADDLMNEDWSVVQPYDGDDMWEFTTNGAQLFALAWNNDETLEDWSEYGLLNDSADTQHCDEGFDLVVLKNGNSVFQNNQQDIAEATIPITLSSDMSSGPTVYGISHYTGDTYDIVVSYDRENDVWSIDSITDLHENTPE